MEKENKKEPVLKSFKRTPGSKGLAVIIDADTLAYEAAVIAETRSVLVKNNTTGRSKEFKNKTEFKKYLKEHDKLQEIDNYTIADQRVPSDVSHALHLVNNRISKIHDAWWPDIIEYYVSGEKNFRNELLLPERYKSNRDSVMRPFHLQAAKDHLVSKTKGIVTANEEPDDATVYRAYELKNQGYDVILGSVEKDSLQYPGLNIWDYGSDNTNVRVCDELGFLEIRLVGKEGGKQAKSVKGEGLMWYCFQVLRGDPVDWFFPYALAVPRFGDMGAYDVLKDAKTAQEALEAVVKQYKLWYPSEIEYKAFNGDLTKATWLDLLKMFHKCARMKTTKDDPLDAVEFYARYGVNLEVDHEA